MVATGGQVASGSSSKTVQPAASQSKQNATRSSSQAGGSSSVRQPTHIEYPRTIAGSLKPHLSSFVPHGDHIKKALAYLTDAGFEYEGCFGKSGTKTVGKTEGMSNTRKPTGRSKAALAAHANQQAFSQDPQIYQLEDAVLTAVDIQYQMEAEKSALDSLTQTIAMGGQLPAADLQTSYHEILKSEIKHQNNKRKQDQKQTARNMDRALLDFRTKVWEYNHPQEPLPSASVSSGAGGDDDDDDEMEIVMTGDSGQQNLKCPLTTKLLENPVTSSSCKHSFSKEAIMSMLQSQRQTMCPYHGCNRPITVGMLLPNKALARKVERERLIQEEMDQAEDEEYTTVE
ncbi:hypothetical protein BG004_005836 [Podila humilis]|nr:hypothetical protein BG004_005836 [Podila humilis]